MPVVPRNLFKSLEEASKNESINQTKKAEHISYKSVTLRALAGLENKLNYMCYPNVKVPTIPYILFKN